MDDEQPATPSFRVLRQTNPCEVVYDHLHGSIGGWRSRRTNSYEMVDACEPTSCFLSIPHHPSPSSFLLLAFLLTPSPFTHYYFSPYHVLLSHLLIITSLLTTYSFPIYSLLLPSLLLTTSPLTTYSSPPYYLLLFSLLLTTSLLTIPSLSF